MGLPVSSALYAAMPSVTCKIARAFADDQSACAPNAATLQQVLDLTLVFAGLTGLKLKVSKCHAWCAAISFSSIDDLHALHIDGVALKHVTEDRLLGAFVN